MPHARGGLSFAARSNGLGSLPPAPTTRFEGREANIDGGALPCVGVHTYVRYVPYGYDHIVALTNGCGLDVSCDVSTDVNPATLSVDVAAGTTSEVVTFKGSPRTTFVASVACARR